MIDIGVAGVVGADRIADGAGPLQRRLRPGARSEGDVYGPFNYLAYVPFEAVFPWDGHWGDVPAAHAAAIAFDLLTAIGLVALGAAPARGRRRAGRSGSALAFAWLAYPFTLYTMNANANDSLIAALGSRRDDRAVLAAGAGRHARRSAAAAKFGSAALAPLFATADRRAALALRADLLGRAS